MHDQQTLLLAIDFYQYSALYFVEYKSKHAMQVLALTRIISLGMDRYIYVSIRPGILFRNFVAMLLSCAFYAFYIDLSTLTMSYLSAYI